MSVFARVRNFTNNHNFADQVQKKHAFAMIEDARKALDTMEDKFEKTEAALHINKADLKAALEREKPTRGSQKVLSKARIVTAGELATSRHIHTTGRRPRGDADSSPPPEHPTKRGGSGRGRGTRGGRFGGSRRGGRVEGGEGGEEIE